MQWGEGAGRVECIACSPQYSHVALPLREFLEQHGLADAASPATSAIQPPRSPRHRAIRQLGEISVTLEQFHRMHIHGKLEASVVNRSAVVAQKRPGFSCPFAVFAALKYLPTSCRSPQRGLRDHTGSSMLIDPVVRGAIVALCRKDAQIYSASQLHRSNEIWTRENSQHPRSEF